MRKVLLVSYFAPPEKHIGALRIEKFLKYLPQYGYQPYVLAGGYNKVDIPFIFRPKYLDPYHIGKKFKNALRKSKSKKIENLEIDPKGLEKLIEDSNKPKGLFSLSEVRMPDKFIFWILPAIYLGVELINREKFDLIYSSSGPPSSSIVASILQKYSKLPWIAEFRDLWSDNPYDLRKSFFHKIDNWIEHQVLRNCDAFVTVSEPLREFLEKKYSKPTYVIYNGYDNEDYPQNITLTEKFTITYTGKIYIGKRDPSLLFESVSALHKEGIITPEILEIRFYGTEQDVLQYLSKKYEIEEYVHLGGSISYKEALLRQKESWLLLLLEWVNPSAKGILTGKVFEYIGARRPILCIGYKESAIKDLLEETGMGIVLNNTEELREFLISALDKYRKQDKSIGFSFSESAILRYSRKKASEELSKIFSKVLKEVEK